MVLLQNNIMTLELVNNRLVRHYTKLVGERTEIILKNVPKSRSSRIKMLKGVELKSALRNYSESQKEDYYSLYNRYQRQWEDLVVLIYGYNFDFNKPNIDYNFGDVTS